MTQIRPSLQVLLLCAFISCTLTVRRAQARSLASPTQAFENWQTQRPELQAKLQRYIYGFRPASVQVYGEKQNAGYLSLTRAQGQAIYFEEHRLALHQPGQARAFKVVDVLLLLPDSNFHGPTVLFLNKCGNHSLVPDPEVQLSNALETAYCRGVKRGWRQDFWAVDTALEQGLGLMTFHESQIAPDEPEAYLQTLSNWPQETLAPGAPPGLLALWSWGLSTVYDYFEPQQRFPVLGLFGHSRRGKTALLTAALDERVDFVLAHQSGTLGAVAVQDQPAESLDSITRSFPHWFTPYASRYAGRPQALPVPPGALLQLQAPRPLLISDGDFDFWASPEQAHQNLERSLPVYQFYLAQQQLSSLDLKAFWQRQELPWWSSPEDIEKSRLPVPLGHLHLPTWHTMNGDYWKSMASFIKASWRQSESNGR